MRLRSLAAGLLIGMAISAVPAFAQYTGEVQPQVVEEPAPEPTPEPEPAPTPAPKPKPAPEPAYEGPALFAFAGDFDEYILLPEVDLSSATFFQKLLDPETYTRDHLGYDQPVVDNLHVYGPTEISWDPYVIFTNFLLALLFFLIVGTSNFVFNNIMESHGDDIHKWVHRVRFLHFLDRSYHSWDHWSRRRRLPVLLIVLLLYAVIGAHINTSIDLLHGVNLGLFVITGIAIVIGAYANDFFRWLVAMKWDIPWIYKPHFMGLFLAVACVIISRTTNVSPGYLFGIPMGLFLLTSMSSRNMGVFEFFGVLWMAVFTLIIWFLMPVVAPFQMISDFDTLLYVILVEALFFLLFPLGYLPGQIVFQWKKWVWGLLFIFTVFMLFHTLFNPNSTLGSLLKNPPAWNTICLLGMFASASLALWAWLRLRARMAQARIKKEKTGPKMHQ